MLELSSTNRLRRKVKELIRQYRPYPQGNPSQVICGSLLVSEITACPEIVNSVTPIGQHKRPWRPYTYYHLPRKHPRTLRDRDSDPFSFCSARDRQETSAHNRAIPCHTCPSQVSMSLVSCFSRETFTPNHIFGYFRFIRGELLEFRLFHRLLVRETTEISKSDSKYRATAKKQKKLTKIDFLSSACACFANCTVAAAKQTLSEHLRTVPTTYTGIFPEMGLFGKIRSKQGLLDSKKKTWGKPRIFQR